MRTVKSFMTDEVDGQAPSEVGWTREPGIKYLVALDVDGTLIDHDGHMSEAVRAEAQAVMDDGHHVLIATGRTLHATVPILDTLGMITGHGVCSNGGVSLRLDPSLRDGFETISYAAFNPEPALSALGRLLPAAKFALEDVQGEILSTERFFDPIFGKETSPRSFRQLLTAKAVRVVVMSSANSEAELSHALASLGLHGVTYMVGHTAWLDISAHGVTKASALEQFRRRLGVDPAHTIAIGDGRNDLEMLRWAARGVAMGQAPAEVRAAAREVTTSVYDDGAAAVLRTLL